MQHRRWLICWVVIVLLGGFVHSAEAAKPAPPVSTASLGPIMDIYFGDSTKDDVMPAVAYNPDRNEFLVVWVMQQDAFTWDIWGRRVGGNGELLSVFNIASWEAIHLANPAVDYNPVNGQYLVVYEYEFNASDHDLYATMVAADGSSHGVAFPVDTWATDTHHPSVTCNTSNGDWLVSYDMEYTNHWDVQINLYDKDTVFVDGADIISASDQYRADPDIAYAVGVNKYIVAYSYEALSPATSRIRGKVFAADLSDIDTVTEQFYDGEYNGKTMQAVAASGADFRVIWGISGGGTIFARRVNNSGVPQGSEFSVAVPPADYMWDDSDIAFSPGFGFLVTYRDWNYYSADDGDIGARYIKYGEDAAWQTTFSVDGSEHYQHSPAVACSAAKCLVVYNHNMLAYPGSEWGIRGRFVYPYSTYIPFLKK